MRCAEALVSGEPPPLSGEGGKSASSSIPVVLSRVLVAVALIGQIVVAWRFWAITWDDSAITLGFARTFAMTGSVEPTPGSGVVEGYSSTLWMLLMAMAAKVVASPAALLAVAKITTLVLNVVNLLLIRFWLLTWNAEVLANLVAGIFGCEYMFYETINGMETPLILTLVLLLLFFLPRQSGSGRVLYLLTGCAFVLVRWEAAWWLLPFVLVERPVRRAVVSAGVWLSAFIVSNIVRWRYFGSFVPNTVIAKRGFPYSDPMGLKELWFRLDEPLHILRSCKMILLTVVAVVLLEAVLRRGKLRSHFLGSVKAHSWQFRFSMLFVGFSLVLSWVIGANTGPAFRSFYSAWPFLLCLVLLPLSSTRRPWLYAGAVALLCASITRRVGQEVRDMQRSDAPVYDAGTTVAAVAGIADVLAEIQSATHRSTLVYAGPDMGGLMLFSQGVHVIDIGLLCDPVLARKRYAAVDSYLLRQRQPDVIEVHGDWTTFTNLWAYAAFRDHYEPVFVHGGRLFLRKELLALIAPEQLAHGRFEASGRVDDSAPSYVDAEEERPDDQLNQKFGTYLVLR